jgi:hypothetical protein
LPFIKVKFSDLRLETPISFLRQLLEKTQASSDHSSGALSLAGTLPESPITRALLSEFEEGVEVSGFVEMSV